MTTVLHKAVPCQRRKKDVLLKVSVKKAMGKDLDLCYTTTVGVCLLFLRENLMSKAHPFRKSDAR